MKKLLLPILLAVAFTGCAKKTDPGVTYKYTVEYTNGTVTGSKSYTCTNGYYYCDPSPTFLKTDGMMCDMNGDLHIYGNTQYIKQEGFKCKNVITKEGS